MAISREKKEKIIDDLEEKIKKQKTIVFVDFNNLDSKSLFNLRKKLKKSKCILKITKKTLLEKVFDKLTEKELLEKIKEIKTQLAIVFSFDDEIIPGKICYQFSKENENLKILGGIFDKQFLEKEKVIELAQLPSRDELLGRLVGTMNSPISTFVNVLRNNIKGLIYVLANAKT
jgi:large subunit ribosomal protein L10